METNITRLILFIIAVSINSISYCHYNKINHAIALKQYDEAIFLMENTLLKDSSNFELFYNLANAYREKENYGLALWANEVTLYQNPTHEGALKNNQYIYNLLELGDYKPHFSTILAHIYSFGINRLAKIALTASLLITLILLLTPQIKNNNTNRLTYSLIIVLCVVIIGCLSLSIYAVKEKTSPNEKIGIVISPLTPTYLNSFELAPYQIPLGTRFELIEEISKNLIKIKLEDGKIVLLNKEHTRLIN